MRLPRLVAALTLASLLVPAATARADEAYEQVARAYAEAGGSLDACAFTQEQLQAALVGIPPQIADAVPELRQAIRLGIDAHELGECEGREPDPAPSPDDPVSSGVVPPVTTPPAPATGAGVGSVPGQPAAEPAPELAPAGAREGDRTALLVALVALGALLLLALASWGWARMRGWDPVWVARARHGWGEAGHRTSSTWSEFADWLRLGR